MDPEAKCSMYPKIVKCPVCPAQVVVHSKEEEEEVKKHGCKAWPRCLGK